MNAEQENDAFWNEVYEARESYFRKHIGDLPEDILKIGHMFGVWPGGGLYVIPATVLGQNLFAYTTFGFSNPDMPASTSVSNVEVKRDELGRVVSTSARLEAKDTRPAEAGIAGYGYEILLLTSDEAEWPLWFLQWIANAEILNDAKVLERVEQYDGLTIEAIQVSESGESINVLIAKAIPPLPTGTSLPNGKMEILVATVVTDDEMHWSMEHGRNALLDKLVAAGIGQTSVRERGSVIV